MSDASEVLAEVAAGLTSSPKALSPKFFYDELGSKLFETITYTPEYYPTRCELEVLQGQAEPIARALGADVVLLELGSGQSTKVPVLLEALPRVRSYVPIDIDAVTLEVAAARLRRQFPDLTVAPVAVDYFREFPLPDLDEDARWVVFYPGSTIGNSPPREAVAFLRRIGSWLRPGDGLLIGFDLEKDPAVLEAAYDDPTGVTAAFNKNMLGRLNREIGTDFDLSRFEHLAFWNPDRHCIEMHLRSVGEQTVRVGDVSVRFADGETLHTEDSHKYTRQRFAELAKEAGFREEQFWTDGQGWFGVGFFVWGG